MDTIITNTTSGEAPTHPLMSWRSVIAGLIIAIFSYMILLSLGVAIGSVSLVDGLETGARGLGAWTGAWIIVTTALSLFVGSYFAARVSKFVAPRIGAAQAAVIAALFFGFLAVQMMATLGMAGQAVGAIMGAGGRGVADLATSTQIADIAEGSMEGMNLQAPPAEVAEGVAVRLLQGNPDAARSYLARQAGMTSAEVQARFDQIQAQVQSALSQAGTSAARAMSVAAWSLFAMMIVGLLAAMGGGFLGSRTNFRKPLEQGEYGFRGMRPSPI